MCKNVCSALLAIVAGLSVASSPAFAGGACKFDTDCIGGPCQDGDCQDGFCQYGPADCDDQDECTDDFCDSKTGCYSVPNEQCFEGCRTDFDCISKDPCVAGFCSDGDGVAGSTKGGGECVYVQILCDDGLDCTKDFCETGVGCQFVEIEECTEEVQKVQRISTSKKGSLLIFPNIELKWDSNGNLTQDTILSITNDANEDTYVHFLFVNGDDSIPAQTCCDPEVIVERAHVGWNKHNWTAEWTGNESNYFSLHTGLPKGAPPFAGLDNGPEGPGRPDPESASGGRVLRGYMLAWAVDATGYQIMWNHLSGTATIVDYDGLAAWEYLPYAAQASNVDTTTTQIAGDPLRVGSVAGQLNLDGWDYDIAFGRLLLEFYGVDSMAFSRTNAMATINTDVTLLPLKQDLRQNNDGPVHVKAKFDVWNQNEDYLSHTDRCLVCWDQVMLSDIDLPNNFLLSALQTDKGKARIEGEASPTVCEDGFCCDRMDELCKEEYEFEHGVQAPICSESAPFVGTALKVISFAASGEHAVAGVSMQGMGEEVGVIKSDLPSPPEPAQQVPNRRRSTLGRTSIGR